MPEQSPSHAVPEGEITGRDRLLAALRQPFSRSQITAAVLLGVLGFAAVVQFRANDEDDRYRGASQQDLIQLINSQQLAQERVEAQIASLEQSRDALLSDAERSEAALEVAQRQASALGILTGTLPAVGPGVMITIDGPPGSLGTQELVTAIQELRSAGAEAIQINETVRVVGQSAIADGPGDSVLIDGERVSPPYVIHAIGMPNALEKGILFPDGLADTIRDADGEVKVRQVDRVEITVTRELPTARFASPAE